MDRILAAWEKVPSLSGEGVLRDHFVLNCSGKGRTANPEGTVTVLFSGTLLNHRELSGLLSDSGKELTSAQILLKLYEKYGPEGTFARLQGPWSAVLCDFVSGKIFCASDRSTLQRIWYFRTPEGNMALSNDLNTLRKHRFFPGGWDLQRLRDYFSLLYVPGGSLYKNVYVLAPGTFLTWDPGKMELLCKPYYSVPEGGKKRVPSYQESSHLLEKKLSESVTKALESTGGEDAGIFLSGGVDSAIIGGLTASRMGEGPLHCCSIAFREKEYDEREGAKRSAAHLQKVTGKEILHHIYEISAPQDFDFLADLVRGYGQPFADCSLIPSTLLCRFASNYGKFFLGGDGADKHFHGYERYIAMRYLSGLDFLGDSLRRMIFCSAGTLLPKSRSAERTFSARLRRFLKAGAMEKAHRYFSLVSHAEESEKMRLCDPDFFAGTLPSQETFDPEGYFRISHNTCSAFDIKTYLADDCITKTRIASSGGGVTVLSPFLQEQIVDFANALPSSFKEKNAYRKRILCDTFSTYLYEGLARSRKRGFGVPVAKWMRQEWKELLKTTLLDGNAVKQGIFSPAGTEALLREHAKGSADHSYLLYCALILELFLQQDQQN